MFRRQIPTPRTSYILCCIRSGDSSPPQCRPQLLRLPKLLPQLLPKPLKLLPLHHRPQGHPHLLLPPANLRRQIVSSVAQGSTTSGSGGPHPGRASGGKGLQPPHNMVLTIDVSSSPSMMTRLTLIDVTLALCSVRSVDPEYQFDNHNCWWFARTSLLLLMCPAQPNLTTEDLENTFFTAVPIPVYIPYGLNNNVIVRDMSSAQETFIPLVIHL